MKIENSKSLERRARENGRAIDSQWIVENESNEFYRSTKENEEIISNLGLNVPKLDKDLQEQLNNEFAEIKKESEINDNLNMQNSRQEKLENSRRTIKDSEKALYDLLDELSVLTKSQDDIEETNDKHR